MPLHVTAFPKGYHGFDPAFGVRLRLEDRLVHIGRSPDCEVRLPDLDVSPHHARLEPDGDGYALTDEGSARGTWLGDIASEGSWRRLTPHTRERLTGLALVRFGPFRALLWPAMSGPVDGPKGRRRFTLDLLAHSLHRLGRYPFPVVYVREGPDQGAWFDVRALSSMPQLVGRGADVDVRVRDACTSRRHFEFLVERGVWVRDVGSSGGTLLGDRLLEPFVATRWRRGVGLLAGRNVFAFDSPLVDALEELEGAGNASRAGSVFLAPSPAERAFMPDSPPRATKHQGAEGDGAESEGDHGPIESTIRPVAGGTHGPAKPPEKEGE